MDWCTVERVPTVYTLRSNSVSFLYQVNLLNRHYKNNESLCCVATIVRIKVSVGSRMVLPVLPVFLPWN